MKAIIAIFLVSAFHLSCSNTQETQNPELAKRILEDRRLDVVLEKAEQTLASKSGDFNSGSHYPETWIRDFATFIEVALEVNPDSVIKNRLLTFFDFQGEDGNIVDGYSSENTPDQGYTYIYSETAPAYKAHKNTVETDQESSLVLAIARYIHSTGDIEVLSELKNGKTVLERCEMALCYLKENRYSEKYGLLIGATTIDWTDVQPESPWGIVVTEDTHWCIDVYDNAIYILAMKEYLQWIEDDKEKFNYWNEEKLSIAKNVKKHLWDKRNQKFIPHVYIEDSPFSGFDENEIYYLGGTVYAILADILNEKEISASFNKMLEIKKESGSQTIAIINFPPYPEGSFFENSSYALPYIYINATDWPWWGGRAIEAMIKTGHLELAYQELVPFLDRVIENNGFYEWYSVIDHQPYGANSFLGSAGALGKAIQLIKQEAKNQLK